MFEVTISKDVLNSLPKKRFEEDVAIISNKLSQNLENDFYRIKPIRGNLKIPTFEMRIHLGNQNFRMAFHLSDHLASVIYLSPHLEKKTFDKEAQRISRKG